MGKDQTIWRSINNSGNTPFRIEGVVHLIVRVGGNKTSAVFGAAQKLKTKRIPATALIDKELKGIGKNSRQAVPQSSHAVAIVESFDHKDTVKYVNQEE